jgi:hypothetical protein
METGFRHKVRGRIIRILHLQYIDVVLLRSELVVALAGLHAFTGIQALGEIDDHDPDSSGKSFSAPKLIFRERGDLCGFKLGPVHHDQFPAGGEQGNFIAGNFLHSVAGA